MDEVGDGFNDIQLMKAAGLSIAYNGREKVCHEAKISVKGDDLRLILPYIEEFAVKAEHELLVSQIG